MANYDFKLKKEVVQKYLLGDRGRRYLQKEYGVDRSQIRTWVRTYNKYGFDGLKKKKKRTYSFDFKMNIVKLYLSGDYSLAELGDEYGIMNSGTMSSWLKQYKIYGEAAFITRKKGRKPDMKKKKAKSKDKDVNEYITSLEEQLKEVQLENKLLKQLRGLRLAKEEQKKKQE